MRTRLSALFSALRETLNKFCHSTASIDKVAPDEIFEQTEDTGDDDGIRAVHEEDAAGLPEIFLQGNRRSTESLRRLPAAE
ncbi:MAG: hypothetical protein NVS1B11_21200 [Terriglobales bacterium]